MCRKIGQVPTSIAMIPPNPQIATASWGATPPSREPPHATALPPRYRMLKTIA